MARRGGSFVGVTAFGEKWAQHWLDLARYAETHGYDKDKQRLRAWPYRDYVIDSFNYDKPFDRFVQEQLAGDVLYPNDPNGIAALGFLAAGPWDYIGHVEVGEGKLDGRIAKHFDRDEMLSAVFNVFMSTTVQCAQCHHHKFDPIRMRTTTADKQSSRVSTERTEFTRFKCTRSTRSRATEARAK